MKVFEDSDARILGLCSVLAIAGWICGTGASEAEAPSSRRARIPLAAPAGIIHQGLAETDIAVRFGDTEQTVEGISQHRPGVTELEGDRAWQVVVYFDAPLATPDAVRQAGKWLGREAASLTRLGPTEIVLADPHPYRYGEPTRDPEVIAEMARDLRAEVRTDGELLWLRQRYSMARLEGEESRSTQAWREETELVVRQRQNLLAWLTREEALAPRLLILVASGHDLNPQDFYTPASTGSFLEEPRNRLSQIDLAKALASEGWTTLCLALGPRPQEIEDPMATLFELAHATGGEVLTRARDATTLLAEMVRWPVVDVVLSGDRQAGVLPLEIRTVRGQQRLKARRWATLAPAPLVAAAREGSTVTVNPDSRAIQLLRPTGLALTGETRIRTITGRRSVDRVAFLLDGEVVAESHRSPFSTLIDLGPDVVPHRVSARAYSQTDQLLGEDSLDLNAALEPPRVTIAELDYDVAEASLELLATASSPSGAPPERIELYLNDRQRAIMTTSPYRVRIEVGRLEPTDVVRLLAHYPSGETAEAARLPAVTGPADELDVNLVELLAMVTPRDRRSQVELQRTDFIVRQRGRPLALSQFSRWQEMKLTLGLVLDTSDSMEASLADARQAGERFFAEALRSTEDEAFVVEFNNRPRLARRLTTDSDELLHSLTGLEARGMTALYDAIVYSLQQFKRSAGRRALVVVTDGEDSSSQYQPRECVRQARLLGVPVYLIVLGSPPDPSLHPELLRNLMVARRTGGEVYYLTDLDDLGRIYDQILSELQRQYFLAFDAGHTLSPEELEEIEIEMVPKGMSVRTLLASQHRGG